MSELFKNCISLTSIDLSGFDAKYVGSVKEMFSGCSSLLKLDIDSFDTSSVLDMSKMFSGLINLSELNVSGFNTENVDSMQEMFSGCLSLRQLDLSNFNTNKVQVFSKMFKNCNNLRQVNIESFDFSNAINMGSMFEECNSLLSLSIGKNDTQNVTNMEALFKNCSSLNYLDVSGLNTQNVTSFKWMFSGLTLKTINLSAMSTINAVNLCGVFEGAKFEVLDLSGFDTANVVDMSQMFMGITNLKIVYVDKLWKTDNVKYSNGMFKNVNLRNTTDGCDDVRYANTSETGYLTPIEAKNGYTIYFDDKADYEIVNIKTNANVLSGDKINFDDKLVVNFTQKANTRIDTVTLNNESIKSGQLVWVDKNLTINTELVDSYALSVQGGFAKLTIINQFGDNLYDGCVVFEGDVLSIQTFAQRGYSVTSISINGIEFLDTGCTATVHSDILVNIKTDELQGTLSQDYLSKLGIIHKGQVKTINFCENNMDVSLDAVDISQEQNWSIRGYIKNNDTGYDIYIESGKKIYLPSDCTRLFSCVELVACIEVSCLSEINGLNLVDTSRVTNMYEMFAYNYNLRYLDVGGFDIKNVDNKDRMFYNCYSLTVDVSRFN